MVLTTAACYLLCWMPYGVVVMMATFGPPNIISPVASVVPSLLAKSSTVINPLIYILMNKQVSRCYVHVRVLPTIKSYNFEKSRLEHVQQLYLHSRKRQTTAEIIELLDLNINSSVISRDFTDQREIKKIKKNALRLLKGNHSHYSLLSSSSSEEHCKKVTIERTNVKQFFRGSVVQKSPQHSLKTRHEK